MRQLCRLLSAACALLLAVSMLVLAPTAASAQATTTSFTLYGADGDFVSQGADVALDSSNATITAEFDWNYGFTVTVDDGSGATPWQVLILSQDSARFAAGQAFVTRVPFRDGQQDVLIVSRDYECLSLVGEVAIHEFTLADDFSVDTFAADFRQSCDGGRDLVGGIRINSAVAAPDAEFAVRPAPTAPSSFTLYGEADDFLTGGGDVSLTPNADHRFVARVDFDDTSSSNLRDNDITVQVDTVEDGWVRPLWSASFAAPNDAVLVPGDEFSGATSYRWFPGDPVPDITLAGLQIVGPQGRSCNDEGEFRIYELVVDAVGNVESFAADFRQSCVLSSTPTVGGVRINSTVPITDRGFSLDDTPPTAEADLIQKGRIKGTASNFDVVAACTDENAGVELVSAEINGERVEPGERVRLIISNKERVRRNSKGKLIIKSAEITLTVTCRDAAGNVSTATAQPSYDG